MLENRNVTDEERIGQLEKELEATIFVGEETDRKFEEVSISFLHSVSLFRSTYDTLTQPYTPSHRVYTQTHIDI